MAELLPRDKAPTNLADARSIRDSIAGRAGRLDKTGTDWRQQVIYFLLPDRFYAAPPTPAPDPPPNDELFNRWDLWAISGRNRFQGGTIAGITEKLPYLDDLGITTVWIAPVWKQRVVGMDADRGPVEGPASSPRNDLFPDPLPSWIDRATALQRLPPRSDYHGYAIQDFLQVDPRFGTTTDLVTLVREAHTLQMRVILDMVINHSGENWLYDRAPQNMLHPPYLPEHGQPGYSGVTGDRYGPGFFLDSENRAMASVAAAGPDDAVWPAELQDFARYSRRGFADYGTPPWDNAAAALEFRQGDWMNRDFRYTDDGGNDPTLAAMVDIWTYWMEVTGCDGFRIDTLKHVPVGVAQRFCEQIRTFARDQLDDSEFMLLGEVGGGDDEAETYLKGDPALRVLDIGERRDAMRRLAGGGAAAPAPDVVLTPRQSDRDRVVTSIDDHDCLFTAQQRFASQFGARFRW